MPALNTANSIDTEAISLFSMQTDPPSSSPLRPAVSPITPVADVGQLAFHEQPARFPSTSAFVYQPFCVPSSEDNDLDVIAVRSALSLLQLQRERSKRNIKSLEALKRAAVGDPHAFMYEVQAQRLHCSRSSTDPLGPTFLEIPVDGNAAAGNLESHGRDGKYAEPPAVVSVKPPAFPSIPKAQNVIRCPPVNWAKYHVVGEGLDNLHDNQKQVSISENDLAPTQRSIMCPYSPFIDHASELNPMKTNEISAHAPF